jgi:heavy metal sensor kinase
VLVGILVRLPTRVRVTLAFSAAMAILLSALLVVVYVAMDRALEAGTDRALRQHAADVTTLIEEANSGLAQSGRSPLTEQGESLAQILDPQGRVVDAPPPLRRQPLVSVSEVRRATHGTAFFSHHHQLEVGADVRLLVTPVTVQRRKLVIVVGQSLKPNEDAQGRLAGILYTLGPVALLIASLAGYGAAAGALRPVERMRRRARQIQASRPGRRLPVPPATDEVSRLGETLNEMLDRLEDAFARERQFVADASHELRTPLAILKGELELALRDADDVEGFREAVESAAEEADRLVALAESLLLIARSDQGRLTAQAGEVDVSEVLEEILRRFQMPARERGAVLRVDAADGLQIQADRIRLEQALGNLLDNALRHGATDVVVAVTREDDTLTIHVRDDGAGFPEDFLPHAFDRFARADSGRTRGGAGLGLAIVRAIAEAHGGRAGAQNRPEGGADVWIELPATAPRPVGASGSVTI